MQPEQISAVAYYDVPSFSTVQSTQTLTWPFPPCINPLARPIPQLGSIDGPERHRSTAAFNFLFRAVSQTCSSRSRMAGRIFNNWKASSVFTYGSGRPVSATVTGDANQDGNNTNDRLPGVSRNSLVGPNYATTDFRLTRRLNAGDKIKLELMAKSFNLFKRDNQRVQITQDGFPSNSAHLVETTKTIGINIFPAQYRVPSTFPRAIDAYAPRQIQVALKQIY